MDGAPGSIMARPGTWLAAAWFATSLGCWTSLEPPACVLRCSTGGTCVSLANNAQEQTKIPYLLLDGKLEKTPETYRLLGELLDAKGRAEQLANYAEETPSGRKRRIASNPEGVRPRVYYGRGINLETAVG